MLKHRFLFFPFLILFTALVLDRIFLLEKIQTYYTRTVSEINFFHKPILFKDLKKYLQEKDRKKVLVYFGNSRALLFDNEYIQRKYPNWILFNFSVPGGTPDYFHYWLLKFQEENVRPDFVLVDNSVEAFNRTPVIKIDESLVNGLDFPFLFRFWDRYSKNELSNFTAKRMFRTYQYRPKLDVIIERSKNNFAILNHYREWRTKVMDNLIRERGSASGDSKNMTAPPELILKYANGDYNSYISNYEFHEDMFLFQKENLEILKKLNIPSAGIWVKVASPYMDLILSKPYKKDCKECLAYNVWKNRVFPLFSEYKFNIWNMNTETDYKCEAFTDASHMASECFPAYTDFIFENLKKETGKQ